MSRYLDWIRKTTALPWGELPQTDFVGHYISTGDERSLKRIRRQGEHYMWERFASLLPAKGPVTEEDLRAIRVLAALGSWRGVARWLDDRIASERDGEDTFGGLCADLLTHSIADPAASLAHGGLSALARGGRPSSAGRYLLSMDERGLNSVLRAAGEYLPNTAVFEFVLQFDTERAAAVAPRLIICCSSISRGQLCGLMLRYLGSRAEHHVLTAVEHERQPFDRLRMAIELAAFDFGRYGDLALETARASLSGNDHENNHVFVAQWMLGAVGKRAVPDLTAYVERTTGITGHAKNDIIEESVTALGAGALPIVLAGLDSSAPDTRFVALKCLSQIDDGSRRELIRQGLMAGFGSSEVGVVTQCIGLAAQWDAAAVHDELWSLVEHRSKPVREAAARALATLGEAVVPEAARLLDKGKVDARLAAVIVLAAVNSPAACRAMECRLADEASDDVREAIAVALQDSRRASGSAPDPRALEQQALRAVSRVKWPPAPWADGLDTGSLRFRDGSQVQQDVVQYVIARQARVGEIRPSAELIPLFEAIDRASASDLALQILARFMLAGADAKDKWALALVGMFGDDRAVAALAPHIRQWVDEGRGKLAEYAVQAMALIATDDALLTIDAIAMRYRNKMRNVGAAAVAAFESAAESLGVTVEELGDRVVPWLGFESGHPREIGCGGRAVQVRIGDDLKLHYRDVDKSKELSSLPASASPSLRAEVKELSALLREVSKMQARRLESLMVRQYRWPVDRWRKLFIQHPLMVPFGKRLVWGAYSEQTSPVMTFRASDDGLLMDHADQQAELASGFTVGVVHPLELDEDVRDSWLVSLAAHRIAPPFPQIERPVVKLRPGDEDRRFYVESQNASVNGLTFKGRAERLGWRHGSVCDGGTITAYVKSFPAAGIDAFVRLQDMFVGIDMYSDIKIEDAFFVASGSVEVGSYVYDEPDKADDPRLIPFGSVPPVVFSEVVSDLRKITASKQGEEAEE